MKYLVLLMLTLLICSERLMADQNLKAQMKKLQDRLDKLEKQATIKGSAANVDSSKSGLKTQDFENKKINDSGKNPASTLGGNTPTVSPEQLKQVHESLEKYKKNKEEADKYLETLMKED